MSSAARVTFVSEHTAKHRRSSSAWVVHSRIDCARRLSDGTQNSTRARPPLFSAHSSASRRAVNVLPVPQAMMSWPRSWVRNPARTLSTASRWCGRSANRCRSRMSTTTGAPLPG